MAIMDALKKRLAFDGPEGDDKRRTQVKLMLSQAEADSLRVAARRSGKSLSEYVVSMHERRPLPKFDLPSAHELTRLRVDITDLPNPVRELHYALCESSTNLARVFSDTGRSKAFEFRPELMELRTRLRDLAEEVLPTLRRLEEAMIEPRERILDVLKRIS